MRSGQLDTQILIERKAVLGDPEYLAPDPDFGTERTAWAPLSKVSGQPEWYWAEVQDAMPSRSESVTQGLAVARNQTRIRFRYRNDVDSSMRVTVRRDTDVVMQIVGGPAMVGGRKVMTEIVCERISS